MRELEQNRHNFEQELEGLRAELEKARLGVNSCQVKLEAVENQLSSNQQKPKELLEALEEGAPYYMEIVLLTMTVM